ncbi:alkaline phosphatase D family protein [Coraliomargarita sp. SDUM461003]|uniref:Alkaline phosphatase D family protein n=1 Tax=Thalassobacterium maritimum TaxID=3041265 RepID=A0ABU1ARG6_9BACT|nr:alkaline phosphatase D family protein [Coraliomargarita sp. SDUM461003]MDQ8206746.1 alkaline phosphatase D family protein [Coraliomargarita sp. SDUM461003]|tara:strand:- start:6086 stop:7114 length:1029 start_codon:yes stop_codon:yes gene_type:complete
MRLSIYTLALASISLLHTPASAKFPDNFDSPLQVIAFGSCNRDELPQPLWPIIADQAPDLWIWGGDNIYADWYQRPNGPKVKYSVNREWITQRYASQYKHPAYAAFRAKTPIIGTWDDHDYGDNNAVGDYKLKQITRDLALSFMEVPISDPRWSREGIYGAYDFGPEGKRTKVILLDNRYFASSRKAEPSDLLGDTQRNWLEKTLQTSTANLHIFVSGTQIISAEHKYEKWADYPGDREWLLQQIALSDTPTVLISGDRHIHEISVLEDPAIDFPLVDITSSGLTHSWDSFKGEPNRYRYGPVATGLGFGLVKIDWSGAKPTVELQLIDQTAEVSNSYSLQF